MASVDLCEPDPGEIRKTLANAAAYGVLRFGVALVHLTILRFSRKPNSSHKYDLLFQFVLNNLRH